MEEIKEICGDCNGKGSHYIVTRWTQGQNYGPEPADGYNRTCRTCGGTGKKPALKPLVTSSK